MNLKKVIVVYKLLPFVLFVCINIVNGQSKTPLLIQEVLSLENHCDLLKEIMHSDSSSISELAYSNYFYGVRTCDNISEKELINYYKNARHYWDSLGYTGKRYVRTYLDQIDFHEAKSEFDSIQYYFEFIEALPKDTFAGYYPNYIYGLNKYAWSYQKTGDIHRAKTIYENCISADYFHYMSMTERALAYFQYAQILIDLDEDESYKMSEQLLFKAIDLYENSVYDYQKDILQCQYNLARIYELTENFDKYPIVLQYYVDNYNFSYKEGSVDEYITFANALGEYYYKISNNKEAMKWLNLAVSYVDTRGKQVVFSSSPFRHLANIYLDENDLEQCDNIIQRGLSYTADAHLSFSDSEFILKENHKFPIESIRLLIVLAKSRVMTEGIARHGVSNNTSLAVLDIAFELFHDVINNAELNKSKYTQKRLFNELFSSMIDQTLSANKPKYLFEITDKIKHSLLRYDLKQNKSDSISGELVKYDEQYNDTDLASIQYGFTSDSLFAVVLENGNYSQYLLDDADSIRVKIDQCKLLLQERTNQNILNKILFELYTKLIKPLSIKSEYVRIIPSEQLANLPFDAFLTDEYDSASFLIKQHTFQYQYSQSLFNEIQLRDYSHGGITASAPEFNDNPNQLFVSNVRGSTGDSIKLYNLPYAREETEYISQLWGSNPALSHKNILVKGLTESKVFHFSGHAISFMDFPEESFLALNSDMLDAKNKMTLNEIYTLKCQNDMVVLSACETGTGKLARAEGILSLARGFFFAGAKSVISTLWSVTDRSSSTIMKNFYTHLKNGDRKDVALRQAKLDYLESVKREPDYLHPFYWAGFVAVGDMSPLIPKSQKPLYFGIGFILLSIFGFGYYRYQNATIS